MFVLNSKIAIGGFFFTTVNEVVIRKSVHSVVETAEVHIPAVAMIRRKGRAQPERRTTSELFSAGDAVVIKLGYNGSLETEFTGYVKNVVCNRHVAIECEGVSWLLRRIVPEKIVNANDVESAIVAIRKMLPGLHVKCKDNVDLTNVFSAGMSGLDVVNAISTYTDGNIQCFMAERDVLWCGRFYTSCANGEVFNRGSLVRYKVGYNALRDSELRAHNTEAAPAQVTYMRRPINGVVESGTTGKVGKTGANYLRMLNHIAGRKGLKQLADERMARFRYRGLDGRLTAFLQPYVQPGYRVSIADSLNKDRDGIYVAESVEVRFGVGGARRIIEVGPRVTKI
jgi:hypothetical protein